MATERFMLRSPLVVLGVALSLAAAGCGWLGDDEGDEGGEQPAFCQVNEQCPAGTVCRWGTCRPEEPDVGHEAPADLGPADEDGGGPPGADASLDTGVEPDSASGPDDGGERPADAAGDAAGGDDLGPDPDAGSDAGGSADAATDASGDGGADCIDGDGDGYGEGPGCLGLDCDDGRADVHPGAEDAPFDGVDQDCDGRDCLDRDGDGYGEGRDCLDEDCDDADPFAFPGAAETPYDGVDSDCDGLDPNDVDGDRFVAQEAGGDDCDDTDATIHPGALDPPGDGVDQGCDGPDPVDADGDGYTVLGDGDCNDQDPNIHPGAEEVPYDGIDQDCVGGDLVDYDGDGHASVLVEAGDDCDDLDAAIHPGADEVPYNGHDDDCDAQTPDEDLDGDGHLAPEGGGEDCDDEEFTAHPGGQEIPYNGIDEDCDTHTRDDDLDRDGFGIADDCDDEDPLRNPARVEEPDTGRDEDCDGEVDEPPGGDCPDHPEMVLLEDGGCMDRWEASRPAAGVDDPGAGDELAATSQPGVLPWTGLSWHAARAACERAGKLLCDDDAWYGACTTDGVRFPYGDSYLADACNGLDAGRGATAPTGSMAACLAVSGAVDLSGNAAEWVDHLNEQTGRAMVSGGAYDSARLDLQCGTAVFLPPDEFADTVGFRCCLPALE